MKNIAFLLALVLLASSTSLAARGSDRDGQKNYRGYDKDSWSGKRGYHRDGKGPYRSSRGLYSQFYQEPKQGELMTGLEGTIELVAAEQPYDNLAVLKTADAAYLLPPYRYLDRDADSKLKDGATIRVDGYVLQPKADAEIPGFDYQGQSIVPALQVTMASDSDGNRLWHRR